MVADAHLEQCLGHTAVARRGGSQHLAFVDHLLDGLVNGDQAADLGQTVLVVGAQDDNGAVGLLELGALHVVGVADGRRKADERRGYVQSLKAAGHRVLAADGRNAQTHLASSAPSRAASGLPQRSGLSFICSKYSWNVRYISSWWKPAQTSLVTLSTTAI